MRPNTPVLVVVLVSVVVGAAVLFGCMSSSPTNPYGGGTGGMGGGGNTAFNSGTLNAPANYVHTFSTAGTVGYHCNFHVSMGMTGTVTIVAGAPDSAVVTASGTSFSPSGVSIKPGGYVHWKVTGGTHTVTSN